MSLKDKEEKEISELLGTDTTPKLPANKAQSISPINEQLRIKNNNSYARVETIKVLNEA